VNAATASFVKSRSPESVRRCVLLLLAVLASGCRPLPDSGASDLRPRVVSLAPSLTEIVCAIGARDLLVGRTSACDYPPEAAGIPVIGGFGDPSMELLAAAKPTLVLDVGLADESMAQKLSNLGLRRARLSCRSLDDIPRAVAAVGGYLHREAAAAAIAGAMTRRIRELRQQAASTDVRPRVFVEIWSDPLMTVGKEAFVSELVHLAGGENIGEEVPGEYCTVSSEWVVSRNPDIVLCLYMGNNGSARDRVLRREGWSGIPAVRTGRVFDDLDNGMILRPGPRVLNSIEELRRRIGERSGASVR
jgi:iron complex transport system substrate-binding protein